MGEVYCARNRRPGQRDFDAEDFTTKRGPAQRGERSTQRDTKKVEDRDQRLLLKADRGAAIGCEVPGPGYSLPGTGQRVPGSGKSLPGSGHSVAGPEERVPETGEGVPGFGERVPGAGERLPGPGERFPGAGERNPAPNRRPSGPPNVLLRKGLQ